MKVAVAIIMDSANRILIAKRSHQSEHGGLWEFPGGKVDAQESTSYALIREIKEEVGLDVIHYDFLGEVNHTYGRFPVTLYVYHVSSFKGVAKCCESQLDLRWVDFEFLEDYSFPQANVGIIELIKDQIRIYN